MLSWIGKDQSYPIKNLINGYEGNLQKQRIKSHCDNITGTKDG
jgi:hypothetical protein